MHIDSTVDKCDVALAKALWSCADHGSDNNSMYPTYILHVLRVYRCLLVRQREISHPTPYLTLTSKACSGNQPCNGALQREIQNTLHHLATSLIYSSRDAMYVGIHICGSDYFYVFGTASPWGKMSLFHSWYLAPGARGQTPTKRTYKCPLKRVKATFTYYSNQHRNRYVLNWTRTHRVVR